MNAIVPQASTDPSFWQAAGDAWAALGKSFKRQECQAAARALETALALI